MKYPVWRRKLHELCVHKGFEIGISSVIGLNILTMAAEHYQQPEVSFVNVAKIIKCKHVM